MVRLIITDFKDKSENEAFYITDEYETKVQLFTYYRLKKHSVYLSKYEVNDNLYSLNVVSKKHLKKNQFLIYIEDEKFIILFNHKTIYSAKINPNFMADDIIKSILTTKHITMLSGGGNSIELNYIINSKYKSALEHLLQQNTKNEKNEIMAFEINEINRLVKNLNELDTNKSHFGKLIFIVVFISFIFWAIFSGLGILSKKVLVEEPLKILNRQLAIEKNRLKKQKVLLREKQVIYKKEVDCRKE